MKADRLYTASDAKYGDFLIDHWFASLRDHVDLSQMEVVVLDYGLSTAQRYFLQGQGLQVPRCTRDGHVVIRRFRDMAAHLEAYPADQVVLSDSGDIIFQADFTPALRRAPDRFRGVVEDLRPAFGVFLTEEFFSKEDRKRLKQALRRAEMVNAGFILGPSAKMAALGREVDRVVIHPDKFGPDQLVVSDVFAREGFERLDRGYNFVVATAQAELQIVEGRFHADGEIIPVVHNSGNVGFLRPVENFGYGPDRNVLKKELYFALRTLHSTTDTMYDSRIEFTQAISNLKSEITRGYQSSMDQVESRWNTFRKMFVRED